VIQTITTIRRSSWIKGIPDDIQPGESFIVRYGDIAAILAGVGVELLFEFDI